jgi:hypothetical protein
MAFSFVSRERYDELQGRYNELIEERRILLDRILSLSGAQQLWNQQPTVVVVPPSSPATPSPADSLPIRQRTTLDSVRAFAQSAINSQPAETYRETK